MKFDLRKAFESLEGGFMTSQELYRAVGNIRVQHRGEFGPECMAGDLIAMARDRGWIRQGTNGLFSIDTTKPLQKDLDAAALKLAEGRLDDAYLWSLTEPEDPAESDGYNCRKCHCSMQLPAGCERVALCISCSQELIKTFAAEYPRIVSELDRLRSK